jgi:hypothetical protein
MKLRHLVLFPVLLVVLFVSAPAFAQAPLPVSSPTITPTVGIVLALSTLAGVLTSWIQTGTLLGRWITPKAWLPDATMLATFLGGFLSYVQSQVPVTLSGSAIGYGVVAGVAALTAGIAPAIATHVHGPLNAQQRLLKIALRAPKIPVAIAVVAGSAMMLLGCLSSAPIVPVTPDNSAWVSSCESTASLHNDVVLGDFVFGAAGTTLAGVAALEPSSNAGAKDALAISAAITGGLGLIGTAVAGYTASNFANSKCSAVVGALPAGPLPAATAPSATPAPAPTAPAVAK